MCTEIETRWHAYWQARDAGYSDAETYDRYLHPRLRVDLGQVLTEHPTAGDCPHAHLSAEVTDPTACTRRHPC